MKKTYGLIILDGFGVNPDSFGNAIIAAGTPYIRSLLSRYPHTTIGASGLDVGLPDGQMGNSEVGHLNMGAGRVVYQELTRISKSVKDGGFFENKEFAAAIDNAERNGGKLHLFGLLSDGGVHSHIEHLFALLKLAKKRGLDKVFVHCFLDGRDVPPTSGAGYIRLLEDFMKSEGVGRIATVEGRYYAMDRDNRWERVKKAYDAITLGKGEYCEDAEAAVIKSYGDGVTDEFVVPKVIIEDGKPVGRAEKGDSVIFFNFRPDRARELSRAFIMPDFSEFERGSGFLGVKYVGMTRYDATFAPYLSTAFGPEDLTDTLGEVLAKNGLTQLRIAETEKYAHVTFFFNGGKEEPDIGEDRALIPSPKVPTYDLQPEMSAYEVAERAVKEIESGKYDVVILNFANCDMVGHTGVFDAAVKAVKTVDICLKKVLTAILNRGGEAIVTADHGNADKMYDEEGKPFTAHTTNPVPFILAREGKRELRKGGNLADVAPTLLKMMGIEKPAAMTGTPLF